MRIRAGVHMALTIAGLLLWACPSVLVFAQDSSGAEKRDAERAWEALIRTKGGRERLYAVSSMLVRWGGRTDLYRFPNDEWFFAYHLDGSPSLQVSDGQKSIQYFFGPDGLVSVAHEQRDEGMAVEQLAYILETKWYKPEPLRVKRATENKKRFDVIETLIGKSRVDFWFEPEEMLVSKVVFYVDGKIANVYRFSDYTKIDGIMVPRRIASEWPFVRNKEFQDLNIMFNVDYDPAIFTPQQKATTPDAWRRKKE